MSERFKMSKRIGELERQLKNVRERLRGRLEAIRVWHKQQTALYEGMLLDNPTAEFNGRVKILQALGVLLEAKEKADEGEL